MPSQASPPPPYRAWAIALAVMAVALVLRVQQLGAQWLTDDEWHVVDQLKTGKRALELLTAVGESDFSIPQALLDKALQAFGPISELAMRMPMLVAGLLLVGLGMAWARPRFGLMAAASFGGLLAISPMLVNYSRTARPYGITVLLAWLAVLALDRWRREPVARWGAAAAACAVLACWLHMAVAPFVLGAAGWVLLQGVWDGVRRGETARLRSALVTGIAIAAGVGLLVLWPAWLSRAQMATRVGSDLPQWQTWWGVWHMWLGTRSVPVVVAGLALAALGLPQLHRRAPGALRLGALGLCLTLAAIYVSRPAWVHNPLTFGRYLLPTLPLLLLCVALGIARAASLLRPPAAQAAAAVLLTALFLIGTPHLQLLKRPNNFSLHYWYQYDYRPTHNVVRRDFMTVPEHPFWAGFAGQPAGSVRFAVAGHTILSSTILSARWQLTHHQEVLSAQLEGFCGTPPYLAEALPSQGFALANAVSLAVPGDLQRQRIDYLVYDHKGTRDLAACVDRTRDLLGEPLVDDALLTVFRVPGSPAP